MLPRVANSALLVCGCVRQKFSGTFTSQDSVLAQLKYTGRLHKSTNDAGRAVLEAEITHVDPWTQQRNVVTLLNRRAYWRVYNDSISTTEPIATKCYPKERIPPVGDLDALFRQASATPQGAVDPNHPGMTPCVAAGNRWIVQWGLQSFVYCQPQSDTHVVRVCRRPRMSWCPVTCASVLPCRLLARPTASALSPTPQSRASACPSR